MQLCGVESVFHHQRHPSSPITSPPQGTKAEEGQALRNTMVCGDPAIMEAMAATGLWAHLQLRL